jgi:hypothetical protein
MTMKNLIAAVMGLVALTLSILPANAERACQMRVLSETSAAQCQPNEQVVTAYVKNGVMNVRCCCVSPTAIIEKGGHCTEPSTVLPGSKTGKKGGFIQMKPNCAAGFVYSESENNCVAAPATAEGDHKPKNKNKKKKKKQHDEDDDGDDND